MKIFVLPSAIPGDQIVEMFEDISAVFDEGLSAAGLILVTTKVVMMMYAHITAE